MSRSTHGPVRRCSGTRRPRSAPRPAPAAGAARGSAGSPHGHRLVEQREDPLRRGHRALEQVELLGEVLQRLEEPPGVLDERRQHAHGERAVEHPQPAVPEQQRHRDRGEHLDRREEHRVDRDRPEVRLQVVPVELGEPPGRVVLAAEELHDPHPAQPLLQERVEPGQPHRGCRRNASRTRRRKTRGREPDQRDHRERHQRQPPVDREHHRP